MGGRAVIRVPGVFPGRATWIKMPRPTIMPDAPFIFVSHSSLDDKLTHDVCDALTSGGSPDGYRVLVDWEGLKGGMNWPLYLIEWMVRCHAAVILLTQTAIPRPWVLKEATILTARRALDPNFRLFVVRFPDTTDLLETHGYGPLSLDTIQQLAYTDAATVAAAIRDELGRVSRGVTPFEELVSRLQDVLANVGAHALEGVAKKLNVVPARLTIAQTDRDRWIETIARHLACGHLGAFAGVRDLIDEFTSGDAEDVRKILRYVSPYWIDPEAASRLPRLLRSAPRRAGVLNGADVVDYTAPLYVRRAHQPSLQFDLIPVGGGSHDQYVDHVTSEICDFMRARRRSSGAKTNDQVVADLQKQRPEWYAVLPPPLPDDEALSQLLDKFPTITFLLWSGATLDVDPRLSRVEWLTPPVDVNREWAERTEYEAAENIIERMTS